MREFLLDRIRLVRELLVRCSPADMHTDWICVPALIVDGHVDESDTPYGPGATP